MAAMIIADLSVRYPGYVSSLTFVNSTSVEGELPEERLLENMPIPFVTGMMKSNRNS